MPYLFLGRILHRGLSSVLMPLVRFRNHTMCFFLGPSPFSVTFLFVLLTLGKSFQVTGSKVLSFLLLPGAPSVSRDVPSSGLCATSATLSDLDRNITRLHAVNFL